MTRPSLTATHPLAARLRLLADEIDSAHRYGVPIPESIIVVSHGPYGGASTHTDRATFDAWADYLDSEPTATVSESRHHGSIWHTVAATINEGQLPVRVQTSEPDEAAVAS